LVITLSVLLVSYLVFYLHDKSIMDVLAVILFSVACYFSSAFKIIYPNVAILLMMGLVILIAMIFPEKTLHMRTLDVMMGGVIGLIANLFILPVRADVEFRKQTILLLKSCSDYLSAITAYLFDRSIEKDLIDKKIQLEKTWESFPDWVFEAGFAANLQQGHRHFLVRIEQVRQILLMLNHLARYSYEEELLLTLETPMKRYVAQLVQLLEAMSTVLVLQKLSDGVEDISITFDLLDAAFQKEVPYSIDSLDINQQNLYLANFIYELGELGSLLIVLTQTLR